MNLEETNIYNQGIEERLVELGDSFKGKQNLDFEWKQKNGLRYVSDESLELAYEILKNMKISIQHKEEKIIISNNLVNLCDYSSTTQDLLEKIKNKKKSITSRESASFTVPEKMTINRICCDCKFQKCPKHIAGYILYLMDKGLLKEKLEDRKKFREKDKNINNVYSFVWNYGEILRMIPENVYLFCLEIVKKDLVYVDRYLVNNESYVRVLTPFSCDDYKLMFGNLENIKSDNKDKNSWLFITRNPNTEVGFCNSYSCELQGCVSIIAGIIYYLKSLGKEAVIEEDRKYYEEHQKEMDERLQKSINNKKGELVKNANEATKELDKYKTKIDKFDEMLAALGNRNQDSLHCTLEGEDLIEKEKFIQKVTTFLYTTKKTNIQQHERISLRNLACGNAYTYTYKENKEKKDKNGVLYEIENAIKYTKLQEKKLYVITDIKGFIADYKMLDSRYNDLRKKQFEHVLDLLVETGNSNYIIIDATTKEIEELLKLNPKLRYIYQNYRFKFHEFDLEETFKLYLKSLDNNIFNKIKEKENDYKTQFMEYISLNKNFIPFTNRELASYLAMYSNSMNDAVFPDNIYKRETVEESLKNIIGLKTVKEKVKEFETYMMFKVKAESQGLKLENSHMHMIFTGNPGTGKTTIARIMAKMLFDMGIIKENKLIEVERKDLVAGYVGQTAQKTTEVIDKAIGGVLFIDEAYSLASETKNDFGGEAIATLIKAMEDHKNELVVIFAGYKKEMSEFIKMNSGIASRIGYVFDFPDYSKAELAEILYKKLEKSNLTIEEVAKRKVLEIMDYFCNVENIGNGRFADKVFQEIILKHAKNYYKDAGRDAGAIKEKDIPTIKEMTSSLFNGKNMIDPEQISDKSLKRTAIHEMGHALVRCNLYQTPGIIKITINPEGRGTLGYVRHKISEEYVGTKTSLLNEIKVCLAGMAAEEVFDGEFANGNTSDLEHATRIARDMITQYGMSRMGLGQIRNIDGAMAIKVQEEINFILDNCYRQTIEILNNHREKMQQLVEYLLKAKEITGKQFLSILNQ